ncbi:hypothetical protein ACP70R_020961 [Stipagrostis hirtigluma subsp. patula]
MPPKPQRCGAVDAGSGGGMPQPKQRRAKETSAAVGSISGGVSQKHRAKEMAAGKGPLIEAEMQQKLLLGKENVGTVSSGGGVLQKNRGGKEKMEGPSRLSSRMPSTTTAQVQADREKNTGSNTSSTPRDFSLRRGQSLSKTTCARRDHAGPSMDAPYHGATALDRKESATKHRAKEKAGMNLSGDMLQKHRANRGEMLAKNMHKGSSGEMTQGHKAKQETGQPRQQRNPSGTPSTGEKHTKSNRLLPGNSNSSLHTAGQKLRTARSRHLIAKTDGNNTAQECTESKENGVVHGTEGKDLQETNDAVKRLNELGLGENISSDEFLEDHKKLPTDPVVDTYTKMDYKQMIPHYVRHARYRIRYYKLSQKASEDKLNAELKDMDLLEKEDFSEEFLDQMRYFKHFESDGTLDWSFDPDLCRLEALDDYQRLVPLNYDGCEYADWDRYRVFFHSYETHQEYLDYCKELSKKLNWMEDYVQIEVTSLKWGMISTRGAYQAIKIASGFSKITRGLAYTGYFEYIQNLRFDQVFFKDLDGVYFEIWLRVTKQEKSFIDALEEVYELNKFPLRQDRMKYALENDYSDMEKEFHTCTASVTSEVTEDRAHELIAEAVQKLMEKPKFYEHYIRKKLAVAQIIGLIPMDRIETIC